MLEYILSVSLLAPCCDTYVGTFENCEQAESYYQKVLNNHEGYSCLHQDFVVLPKNFEHHYIVVTEPLEIKP